MKYVIGFVAGFILLMIVLTIYDYATCEGAYLIDCRPISERQPLPNGKQRGTP